MRLGRADRRRPPPGPPAPVVTSP